jgi:hypothetical protein
MSDNPARSYRRFHLETLVVLMFVIGIFIWGNVYVATLTYPVKEQDPRFNYLKYMAGTDSPCRSTVTAAPTEARFMTSRSCFLLLI